MRDTLDKLTLNTSDDEALAEYFSRKSPGEKCSGSFEGTLDENHEGVVVLSVTDITVAGYKDKETVKEAADDASTEPAFKVAKRRKAAEKEESEGMGY